MVSSLQRRVLATLLDAQASETRAALWSFGYFFVLLTGYYILRPVREAMAIAGGVDDLPWMFTAVLVAMLVAVPVYGTLVARLPRRHFVPIVYRFFALNLCGFAVLIIQRGASPVLAQVFFVWVTVYNLFVVSVFWSVMADVFDTGQGKRLFGFIAAGGSAGALLGSWLTGALAERVGLVVLLLVSAGFLEAATQCFHRVTRAMASNLAPARVETRSHAEAASSASEPALIGGSILAGATRVFRSLYLGGISFYLVCLAVAGTFLYVARAEIVAKAFDSHEARSAFFATINGLTSLLTLLLQLLLTARLLGRLGVGLTLALIPLATLGGFAALAMAPTLAALVGFQIVLDSSRHAIARPGREMLFIRVSREDKYKAKNFIDTAVFRGGDALSSWLFRSLQAAGLALASIAVAVLPLVLVWLATALWLGRPDAAAGTNTGTSDSQDQTPTARPTSSKSLATPGS